MLIGKRRKRDRYGMGYSKINDCDVKKTLHHRFDVLDEEIEAWFRGLKLANRLKIKIDKETFHTLRLQHLKSYAKWAVEPKQFID